MNEWILYLQKATQCYNNKIRYTYRDKMTNNREQQYTLINNSGSDFPSGTQKCRLQ